MNAKIIAGIIIAIVFGVGIYFATQPISGTSKSEDTTHQHAENHSENKPEEEKETDETAFADFQNWLKKEAPTPQETENYLVKLEEKYPDDYRFTLERIRGAAKVKGLHSHKKEFEILEEAARKAVACECGDASKMLADLTKNKSNKERGFWKLSTHPREWKAVLDILQ
jgi:hypothetical protein